ncbi:MAG: glycosyltransferase family 87 protein [Anaerolineae bacterium]
MSGALSALPSRWLRLALAVHVGIALGFVGLLVKAAWEGLLWRADFTAFYTGGAIVRDGLGDRLYDLPLQTRVQQAILGPGRMFLDGVLPFNNPPHFALVMAPFTLLPLGVAFWCWTVVQVGVLARVFRLLSALTTEWTEMERWMLFGAFGAFLPLLIQFLYGSLSLFVLMCLIEFYLALKRGKDGWAGIWLALAAVKPQAALFPALILLGGRRWRAIAGAGTMGLFFLGATAAVLGPAIWPAYLHWLAATAIYFDRFGVYPEGMMNLKGTLTLWLGVGQAPLIQEMTGIALAIGAAAILVLWARGRWEPERPVFDRKFSFTLTLGLLLAPHLNQQDCLSLVLPAVLFYDAWRCAPKLKAAAASFLLSWPVLFLLEEFLFRGSLGVRLPVLLMAVLLVWMRWMAWKIRTGVPQRGNI